MWKEVLPMQTVAAQGYSVVSSLFPHEGGSVVSYGLSFQGADGTSILIPDISCNGQLVTLAADLFNLCELPADRFKRVVIDLLP